MKQKIIVLIFSILSVNIYCQNLVGTKWFKINAERKDGSVLYDRFNTRNSHLEYHFKNGNEIDVISSNNYKSKTSYKINNSKLLIGKQTFIIEKINSTELIICEKAESNVKEDKINRFHFIKSNKLISYLRENKLISFLNDSTIITNKYLKPKLKNNRSIDFIIQESIKKNFVNSYLIGNFHINRLGIVDKINIIQNSKVSKRLEQNFKQILYEIKFMPFQIDKKYNQLVNFNIAFKKFDGFTSIRMETNTNEMPCMDKCGLSIDEMRKVRKLYYKGNLQINKKEYEKAIKSFTKAVEIDSLFFDAYYNRAYVNMLIRKGENACRDWEYLKKMGQKEATHIYNEECN